MDSKSVTKPRHTSENWAKDRIDIIEPNMYKADEMWDTISNLVGVDKELLIEFAGQWALLLDPYKAAKACKINYDIVHYMLEDEAIRGFLVRFRNQRMMVFAELASQASVEVIKGMMLSVATRYSQLEEILKEAPSDKQWLGQFIKDTLNGTATKS